MDPLETLRQEHRTALRVVRSARAQTEREFDAARTAQTIDFFRYFVNACHSPKEEDLLFIAVHRHGLAWEDSPLHELVGQHLELRVVLDSVSDWLPPAAAGAPGAVQALLHDLRLLLDLFERHIALEEQVLFPLALERLDPRDLEELTDVFAAIACDEQLEGAHDYYAGVARQLAGAGV